LFGAQAIHETALLVEDHHIGLDQLGIDTHNIIGWLGRRRRILALNVCAKGSREGATPKGRQDKASTAGEKNNQLHEMNLK
jgi:hypothetical protein